MRRAPAGMTADKCPICHFESQQKDESGMQRFHFRSKDEPCQPCKAQMKKDAEELRILRERLVSRKAHGTDREYLIAYHPYFPHNNFKDTLSGALRDVVTQLGVAKYGDDLRGGYTGNLPRLLAVKGDSYLAADFRHVFSKVEADAIQKLFEEIKAYGEHAYAEGKRRGSDILLSLQSGDIGLSEFDEKKTSRY